MQRPVWGPLHELRAFSLWIAHWRLDRDTLAWCLYEWTNEPPYDSRFRWYRFVYNSRWLDPSRTWAYYHSEAGLDCDCGRERIERSFAHHPTKHLVVSNDLFSPLFHRLPRRLRLSLRRCIRSCPLSICTILKRFDFTEINSSILLEII